MRFYCEKKNIDDSLGNSDEEMKAELDPKTGEGIKGDKYNTGKVTL